MPSKGPRKKLRNGLTPKANAFKNKVLEQIATKGEINGTEAASQVYEVKNRNTARAIAAENLAKPAIKASIEEALNSNGGNLDQISKNLTKLSNFEPSKISGDTVLKANIEMLKLLGAYPDKKTFKKTITQKHIIEGLAPTEANQEIKRVHTEVTEFMQEAEIS